MNYPKVLRDQVDGFLKVYNRGGLHLIFDDVARQAMVDFTNVALRSFVDDLAAKAKANATQPAAAPVEPPAPTKSLILTDL